MNLIHVLISFLGFNCYLELVLGSACHFVKNSMDSADGLTVLGNSTLKERVPAAQCSLIYVTGSDINHLQEGIFNQFPELTFLCAKRNMISSMDLGTFTTTNLIEGINLSENNLKYIPQNVFQNNSRLKYFSLNQNPVFLPYQKPFLISSSVNYLHLSSCNISELYKETFSRMPNIFHLILSNNKITEINSEMFMTLKYLKVLNMSGNMIKHILFFSPQPRRNLPTAVAKDVNLFQLFNNCCEFYEEENRTEQNWYGKCARGELSSPRELIFATVTSAEKNDVETSTTSRQKLPLTTFANTDDLLVSKEVITQPDNLQQKITDVKKMNFLKQAYIKQDVFNYMEDISLQIEDPEQEILNFNSSVSKPEENFNQKEAVKLLMVVATLLSFLLIGSIILSFIYIQCVKKKKTENFYARLSLSDSIGQDQKQKSPQSPGWYEIPYARTLSIEYNKLNHSEPNAVAESRLESLYHKYETIPEKTPSTIQPLPSLGTSGP